MKNTRLRAQLVDGQVDDYGRVGGIDLLVEQDDNMASLTNRLTRRSITPIC